MKSFKFYSAALAGLLMLGACSSSDDLNGGASGATGNTSYLAVNIKSVGNASASRVNEEDYVDGQGTESAINKVRFYFFNADGTPYILNSAGSSSTTNFLDVNMTKKGNNPSETVETTTEAVLVLNGEANTAPASMLAVVNPDICNAEVLGNGTSQRLSYLRTSATGSKWMDNTGFVMSNSTYKESGVDVCSTQLAGKLYASSQDATDNPTPVYVERVVAKVNVSVNEKYVREGEKTPAWSKETTGSHQDQWKIKVGTLTISQDENSNDVKNYDIYAWIQGWGIADEDGKAELTKQIDNNWTDATLGFEEGNPWNVLAYHRCFWSRSVPFDKDNSPVNHPFNAYTQQLGTAKYTLPNTPDSRPSDLYNGNNLTKVLVAAKLGYQDGDTWKEAEICSYKGQDFLGIANVKKVILNELKKYYLKKSDNTYENMTADNIDFDANANKDYLVKAVLKNVSELYQKDDNNNYVKVELATVNNELAQNTLEIRKDGAAYYYVPIKHMGKSGSLAEYGVVRNHSYQVTINNMQGFGTPVYNPAKVIVPTIPTDSKAYLAANINVLSWRVVNSSVNLDQTNK